MTTLFFLFMPELHLFNDQERECVNINLSVDVVVYCKGLTSSNLIFNKNVKFKVGQRSDHKS